MKKYLYILLMIYLFHLNLPAQQMAEHNLYYYNLSLINPAATGYLPCKQFTLTDRHQWLGIKGAPSIQSFGVQLPRALDLYRSYGLGVNLVRDDNGATQNLGGEIQYAYHITLNTNNPAHLGFGLSAKFGQYSFDESGFNPDLPDPIVTYGRLVEWYYNFATGVFLYSDNYYAGVGVYNLYPMQSTLYDSYGNTGFFTTVIAGYKFSRPRRYRFTIDPSIYFAYGADIYQVDLGTKLFFENGICTGIFFRKYMGDFYSPGQNILLFFGYQFSNWNIGYTYDLGINQLQKQHFGSHQLSLTYTICREKYSCPAY